MPASLPTFLAIFAVFLSTVRADVPVTRPTPADGVAPGDPSADFTFEQVGSDPSNYLRDAHDRSGGVYLSYRPGNVWFGERPGFVSPGLEIGGEDLFPNTDVYEDGALVYAHYGPDHYQTRWISVIDETRREILRIDCREFENLARVVYEEEGGVLYYTVVESNLDGIPEARLHAWSVKESRPLWRSEAGTAHGDFLVYGDHILTHYGFTGEDDFVCVIDKATGATRKKAKIATAAERLIREGDKVIVPCYEGVVTFSFSGE